MAPLDVVDLSGIVRINFVKRSVMTSICSCPSCDFGSGPNKSKVMNERGSLVENKRRSRGPGTESLWFVRMMYI